MYTIHPPSVPNKRLPASPQSTSRSAVKAVGPGRLERAYQSQVARLSRELQSIQQVQQRSERELEMARLLERGTRRFVDRMETEIQHREARASRALVLAGGLQQENQRLQAKILGLESRLQRLSAPHKPSTLQQLWSKCFGAVPRLRHAQP